MQDGDRVHLSWCNGWKFFATGDVVKDGDELVVYIQLPSGGKWLAIPADALVEWLQQEMGTLEVIKQTGGNHGRSNQGSNGARWVG